jgi:hypothetical protein
MELGCELRDLGECTGGMNACRNEELGDLSTGA